MPEPNLVAIGEEYKRIGFVLVPKHVGVVGGLPLAFEWIAAGAFGLDDCNWPAQTIREGVVGEPGAGSVDALPRPYYAGRRDQKFFDQLPAIQRPAGSTQLEIDLLLPRLPFRTHATRPEASVSRSGELQENPSTEALFYNLGRYSRIRSCSLHSSRTRGLSF